ncbi:glycosyltransferase [Candidatus Uabimicrobium amorphum]|uniref:Glycosyl transferase n=1 Tax=Uabimicrobium amorphum TaxID=2596890 RepID=A0A5S9ILG3_UABAM|nr:glycosyltransferase [Candidatus Uabimicrobium amorphum]BBM84059.1 glycosyl transferase [Candidatus Uabimicrobium amorphum]
MKIVQVITELRPAGAERIVLELSRGLKKNNHDVAVISLLPIPEKSVIVEELHSLNIEVYSLNLTKFCMWRIFKLRSMLRNLQPQIVHAHLIHANIVTRLNAWRKQYILVNSVHIAEKRPGKKWHFLCDRFTLRHCDSMTVVSNAVQRFHSQKLGIHPSQLPVIYNGIDIPAPISQQQVTHLKKLWKVDHCTKIIGSIGRLEPQKGYDMLFELLPTLSNKIPENESWAIVILGEGQQREVLQQYPSLSNIEIRLPGFRKDAAHCIGAFDLFVMPSRYEGFGLALVEAMSHGVPILANDVDSLPELLQVYQNGSVTNFANINTVEKMIKQLAISQRTPYKEFTLPNMISQYLDLYCKLYRERNFR